MAAIDASIYEELIVESTNQVNSVDIRLGTVAIKGKDGTLQSLYSGLPLRGGERVFIKIAGNSKTNKGIDLKDQPLYVSKISNVIREGQRESFVLKLVSRESIESMEVHKYQTMLQR